MGAGLVVFGTVLAGVSVLGLLARRRAAEATEGQGGPRLADWVLGGRPYGTVRLWFVLGGSLFTAYTFIAVPALVYGVGGLGMFALPYTVMFYPVAFVVLPRLWRMSARNGYLTPADLVRGRTGSPGLAALVAVTGVLATMPYLALQLLGLQAALVALGVPSHGPWGDGVLTVAFAVLAVATYRGGIAAPALVSYVKAALVFAGMLTLLVVTVHVGHGFAAVFAHAGANLSSKVGPPASIVLDHRLAGAYVTLAVGSALALPLYPHVFTAAMAARDDRVLARSTATLPAWSGLLWVTALLGVAALAAGITTPAGHAELALPLLAVHALPGWAAGAVLAAVGVAALVPAAMMSISVAALVTRNLYVEYLRPEASEYHQLQVARVVSVVVKFGALAFVIALRAEDAINLQLL
ncbi:MAG: sodium:solute symporter family transporter, partial [Actinomycetes bacterium]